MILKFISDRINGPLLSQIPHKGLPAISNNTGNVLFLKFRQLSATQLKPIFGLFIMELCNLTLSFLAIFSRTGLIPRSSGILQVLAASTPALVFLISRGKLPG
jgi:hypothetical protein